ncbi:MAG: permease [Eubacteriales bacterium]|nr:permease [Eubacteriales bacterium]
MFKQLIKQYRLFLIASIATIILYLINREVGLRAIGMTTYSFKEMFTVLPPVFLLLGLLDVWVPRELMITFMGEKAGIKGILLAFFLGSAAAGPLYGAFPVAAVLMKKGARFSNVMIFIGAWSTTKIPMFLFEMASLGKTFAFTRLLVDKPGIIIIALLIERLMKKEEIENIYINASKM